MPDTRLMTDSRLHRRRDRGRPQAVRGARRLREGRRRPRGLAEGRPPGGRLRRPLQCRQVEPHQRARQPQESRPRFQHAGPHAGDQLLRSRRGRLYLVDLPGYGFADAPKKSVDAWGRFTLDYLRSRSRLKRVFVLIDSRRGVGDVDLDYLRAARQRRRRLPDRSDQDRQAQAVRSRAAAPGRSWRP